MGSDLELEFPLYLLHAEVPGTQERVEEARLIRDLDAMGEKHGYEEILTLSEKLESLWRDSGDFPNPLPQGRLSTFDGPEREIVAALKVHCDRHGYGRVPQLALYLSDIRTRGNQIAPLLSDYADRVGRIAANQVYRKGLDDMERWYRRLSDAERTCDPAEPTVPNQGRGEGIPYDRGD